MGFLWIIGGQSNLDNKRILNWKNWKSLHWRVKGFELKKKRCVFSLNMRVLLGYLLIYFSLCHLLYWIVRLRSVSELHLGSLWTNQEPQFQAVLKRVHLFGTDDFSHLPKQRGLQLHLKLTQRLWHESWLTPVRQGATWGRFTCEICLSVY